MNELTINPNRIELDEAYMQMAEVWAKRSKGNRLQVGALVVKGRQIISDGYNGTPTGSLDDVCEYHNADGTLATKPEVLHAESNALMKIAENGGVGAQGATLYVTVSPCFECAKLITQAKIKRVVFRNLYRTTTGIELLQRLGVSVEQLSPTQLSAPTVVDPFEQLRRPPAVPTVEAAPAAVTIIGRPSEYRPPVPPAAPVAQARQASVIPPGLESPPILKAPEPIIQQTSEEEIQAMLRAAGISDGVAPAAPAKASLLSDDDSGTYRSPFL